MFLLLLGEVVPELRDNVTLEVNAEYPLGMNVSCHQFTLSVDAIHLMTYTTQKFGVREFNYVWVCYEASSPSFYWQIFAFAYLAILQIIGIVLAFQTRKVKMPGLRDSKFVAAVIYISSIILVVLALVTFTLRTYINIGTGIIATGIFTLTTTFLGLVFIPKVSIQMFTFLTLDQLIIFIPTTLPQTIKMLIICVSVLDILTKTTVANMS